jgi:hypothetical protein
MAKTEKFLLLGASWGEVDLILVVPKNCDNEEEAKERDCTGRKPVAMKRSGERRVGFR